MRRARFVLGFGVFVFAAAGTAKALPELGLPFATDPPVPVQADTSVYDLHAASVGGTILTIFEEGGNIRGMLTDTEGAPLISEMAVYAGAGTDTGNYYPAIAAGPDGYLVAWAGEGVWAQRVGVDGIVQGEPIALTENGYYPSIVWGDGGFIVAWQDLSGEGSDLGVSLVGSDGTVTSRGLLTSSGDVAVPRMAGTAAGALVTWASNQDSMNTGVLGLLLDGAGTGDGTVFPIRSAVGVSTPEVTSGAGGYLVAWTESATTSTIVSALISAGGEVSEPATVVAAESVGSPLSLGFDGSEFTVIWKDYTPQDSEADALMFRHLSSAGEVLGEPSPMPAEYPTFYNALPSLLTLGEGYFVAYQGAGVFGAFTDPDLVPSGPSLPLSFVPSSQNTAYLAFDGTNYLMVWADERDGEYQYSGLALRVNQAGQILDPEPLAITGADDRGSWFAVASTGAGSSLVAWTGSDDGQVHFRTVSSAGELGATVDSGVNVPSGGVSLATDGESYLAVFQRADGAAFLAQPFDAAGQLAGAVYELAVPEGTQDVRVMAGDEGYLLELGTMEGESLAGLQAQGAVSEPQPLGTGGFAADAVRGGGGKTAIVWTSGNVRYGRFWSGTAFQGEAFTLSQDGNFGQTAWDGERFAAVWQDSEYHGHWTTFDLEGNVGADEPLFGELECNGPTLVFAAEGHGLLSCIRYNADYARRLVNYLVGAPVAIDAPDMPGGEMMTPAPSATDAPPVATAEPAASGSASDATDTSSSSAPEGSGGSELAGEDPESVTTDTPTEPGTEEPATSDSNPDELGAPDLADAGAGQVLLGASDDVAEDDGGGCRLAPGSSKPAAGWLALGVVAFALRRRRRCR